MKAKSISVGPQLHVGVFSGRVLLAKNVKATPNGDGTAMFNVVGEQIDIHDQFLEIAKRLGYVLRDEKGSKVK